MSNPDIHQGLDGWLFLIGGSNNVGKMFADKDWISEADCEIWRQLLLRRKEILAKKNIRYVHFWVPDKLSVYREFVADQSLFLPQAPMDMIRRYGDWEPLADIYLDIRPAMEGAKTSGLLYWKTDTHWTFAGACAAYSALCSMIGASPAPGFESRPQEYVELALDLGSKLTPPVKENWGIARVLSRSRVVHKNELVKLQEIMKPNLSGGPAHWDIHSIRVHG